MLYNTEVREMRVLHNPINYLGRITKPGCLEAFFNTSDAICSFQTPCNIPELRAFFSLCHVCRHFIPNSARIAAPFIQNVQKDQACV